MAAYRRGDLFENRRELKEVWSEFCASPNLVNNSPGMKLRR